MQKKRDSIYKRFNPAVSAETSLGSPAYWFVFSSNKLLVTMDVAGMIRLPFAEDLNRWRIKPIRQQYLGVWNGAPCYSVEAEPDIAAPEGMEFRGLFTLYGTFDEDLFHLAGRAIQMVEWDQTNQYCSRCGSKMDELTNERAKVCPSCSFTSYPRISPAVITAILKGKQLLLAHAQHFQGDMYSLIAGFVEPGETLEDAVQREIMEEVGLKVKNIRYFGSQQWPFPHSLMIGFIAEYESGDIVVDGEEIAKADWFDADQLPEIPTEISIARKMINWYAEQYTDVKELIE
ncbi:MAG: NAD(+) diphosphatase [Gorillibacterium sp.]|nr:NAD(+) diphosphatase [Gorillibacterium sp.]